MNSNNMSKSRIFFSIILIYICVSLVKTTDAIKMPSLHQLELDLKDIQQKLEIIVKERIKGEKELRMVQMESMKSRIALECLQSEGKRFTAPDPPFSETEFKTADLHNKTVVDWINMFPPYSRQRLAVVTTLLNESVDKWAMAGFVHGCMNRDGDYTPKCTICNDRYAYIKCVMSGEVTGPINSNGQTRLFLDDDALTNARHNIQDIICNSDDAATDSLTDHFLNIEKAIEPFQVKRADDIECRICTDFHRKVYDPCFSQWQHFEH